MAEYCQPNRTLNASKTDATCQKELHMQRHQISQIRLIVKALFSL